MWTGCMVRSFCQIYMLPENNANDLRKRLGAESQKRPTGQDPSAGRILQSIKSLNETTKKQGPKPGSQSLAAAQDSRVIIRITRRILGLPLFLQLTRLDL